jgi:hypothetical protein
MLLYLAAPSAGLPSGSPSIDPQTRVSESSREGEHVTHHQWVKLTQTKVSTIPDIDEPDKVTVVEDPEDVAEAEERAVFGCKICGVTLEGNSDTLCSGEESD